MNSWGEHEEANVDETGWIGNILKEFAKVKKDVEEEVINVEEEATHDNHDIEPPLLDPKWGLAADPGIKDYLKLLQLSEFIFREPFNP